MQSFFVDSSFLFGKFSELSNLTGFLCLPVLLAVPLLLPESIMAAVAATTVVRNWC